MLCSPHDFPALVLSSGSSDTGVTLAQVAVCVRKQGCTHGDVLSASQMVMRWFWAGSDPSGGRAVITACPSWAWSWRDGTSWDKSGCSFRICRKGRKPTGLLCNCMNLLSTLPYCCLWWGWKCGNWKRPRGVEELPCKEQHSKWGQSCRAMTGQRTWVRMNSLSLPAQELEAVDEGTTHSRQQEKELNFLLGYTKMKWHLFMWTANCV